MSHDLCFVVICSVLFYVLCRGQIFMGRSKLKLFCNSSMWDMSLV